MIPYDSPRDLALFLKEKGFAMKKQFGQNFLVNPRIREKIVEVLAPEDDEVVWEVGPGLGCMTKMLLDAGVRVRCFEIDHGFIRVLNEEFGQNEKYSLVSGDVVKSWKDYRHERPGKIFGNLPYSAASAMIGNFLENDFLPGKWVFMLQKEVAQRMIAKAGTKNYSSFSVLCQSFGEVKIRFDVSSGSFYPSPDVLSSVVEIGPRRKALSVLDRKLFLETVRAVFSSRRKTLRNTILASRIGAGLGKGPVEQAFKDAGIDPGLRGEVLLPEEIAVLSDALSRTASAEA